MGDAAAAGLEAARRRTLQLTDVDADELTRQHSPLMSPLVWDLAHIGQQEDLWLLRNGDAAAQGLLPARIEQLYDAFEHPRAERVSLPLLTPAEARAYLTEVRGRVFEALDHQSEEGPDGLVPYVMVEQGCDLDEFDHVAMWSAEHEWIEMRVRSRQEQTVRIAALGLEVRFQRGEELRTEISAKFRRATVERELSAAGLRLTQWWTDPSGDFALSLSVPA